MKSSPYPTLDTTSHHNEVTARKLHHRLHDLGMTSAHVTSGQQVTITLSGVDARSLATLLPQVTA